MLCFVHVHNGDNCRCQCVWHLIFSVWHNAASDFLTARQGRFVFDCSLLSVGRSFPFLRPWWHRYLLAYVQVSHDEQFWQCCCWNASFVNQELSVIVIAGKYFAVTSAQFHLTFLFTDVKLFLAHEKREKTEMKSHASQQSRIVDGGTRDNHRQLGMSLSAILRTRNTTLVSGNAFGFRFDSAGCCPSFAKKKRWIPSAEHWLRGLSDVSVINDWSAGQRGL